LPSGKSTIRLIPSFPIYSFNFILSGFDLTIECKKDGFGFVFFDFGSIRFSLMINTLPLPLGYIFVDSVITSELAMFSSSLRLYRKRVLQEG